MAVLVCGGAGYIGSHAVYALIEKGEEVAVIDNLQTGHRSALHPEARFYEGDIRSAAALDRIFTENEVDAVVHFAANSLVGESMEKPLLYFNNNVYGMQVLLEAMVRHSVDKIVFSSTAAVYGEPKYVPIREEDETKPTNAYGETKLTMEKMMKWVSRASGIRYVSLRYFNAAGALPNGVIGEDHATETHLIPLILQVPNGKRDHITVYGDDYPTPDGTCLRDYIHVMDLAAGHVKALEHIADKTGVYTWNLGSGTGSSVLDVVRAYEKACGKAIPYAIAPRRAGDLPAFWANPEKAARELGWRTERSLDDMMADTWRWQAKNPQGYR